MIYPLCDISYFHSWGISTVILFKRSQVGRANRRKEIVTPQGDFKTIQIFIENIQLDAQHYLI